MKLFSTFVTVTFLSLATLTLANTAQVRFIPRLASTNIDTPLTLSPKNNALTLTSTPQFVPQNQTFLLDDLSLDGTMYEVRVCWPASSPLEFNMIYEADTNSVTLEYFSNYVSHIDKLNRFPLPATYQVVLNKVVLGTLPEDIFGAVILAVIGGASAYFLGGWVYQQVIGGSKVCKE